MSQMTREDMLRELELLPVWQLREPLPAQLQAGLAEIQVTAELPMPTAAPAEVQASVEAYTPAEIQAAAVEMPPQPAPEIELPVTDAAPVELPVESPVEPPVEPPEPAEAYFDGEPVLAMPEVEISLAMPVHALPLRLLKSEDGAYAILIEPHQAGTDVEAVETLLKNMLKAMRLGFTVDVAGTADKLFAEHTPKLIISMGAAPANELLQKSLNLEAWRDAQFTEQVVYGNTPLIVTYHPAQLLENAADKAHAWRDLCLAMKLMQHL